MKYCFQESTQVGKIENELSAIAEALHYSMKAKKMMKKVQLSFSVIKALTEGELKTKILL